MYGAPGGEIALYRAPDGTVSLDVRLERETIWLTQAQMVILFGRDQSVIARHLGNVFAEGELPLSESNMQKMHIAGADRPVMLYIDVIISVGYRVKSKRGTQFRIWATRVLREHILKGYSVNERRLRELNQAVRLIADVAERRSLTGDEATALLRVVADYSRALDLLDDYDHQRVSIAGNPYARGRESDHPAQRMRWPDRSAGGQDSGTRKLRRLEAPSYARPPAPARAPLPAHFARVTPRPQRGAIWAAAGGSYWKMVKPGAPRRRAAAMSSISLTTSRRGPQTLSPMPG